MRALFGLLESMRFQKRGKMKFAEALLNKRIYLDGAMGSALIEKGFSTFNPEELNITVPDDITAIHRNYVLSGSNAVYTNTLGANSLKNKGKYTLEAIIGAACDNARRANPEYIGYDCGPLGALLYPYGELTFEKAYELFAEQAKIVADKKVDFVVIETIADTLELKAAILAFKENCDLPIICSMTFDKGGRSFVGCSVGAYAQIAQGLGVDAIGINCGSGPDIMRENIKELIKYARLPVFAKPNAGIPSYKNGKTVYDMDAAHFTDEMDKIARFGVSILGGCCGTTYEYIDKIVKATKDLSFTIFDNHVDAVCSGRRVVELKTPVIVGERLNPTGKPLLKQAIIEDNYDYMLNIATEQLDAGADILDINMGMSGIDEREKLVNAVIKLQGVIDAPLQLDSARASAIDGALRVVDGVPIINSVNGEEKSMAAIFPLAKKYGAYIIALCLDENGIPDLEGRLEIAERIAARAREYGISEQKLIFDPLTLAISVDKNNAINTLEGVKRLYNKGYKTTLGLSNVSFGLPYREAVNATFYEMAVHEGLTLPIINPSMKKGKNNLAEKALRGEDANCERYIEAYSGYKPEPIEISGLTIEGCVMRGLKKEGVDVARATINKDNYIYIINNNIINALNELGVLYENGKAFLPQLIAGAESAKAILSYIREHFMGEAEDIKAVVLLATVKGDVHDIGKNIVKAVLSNYGYKIHDLGKNVSTEDLLHAVERYSPQVVGLSALMTTTLDNMAESAATVRALYPNIIIMVGGAVVSCDFARRIGAHYSKDAQECVRVLDALLKI
ncbi:MAG: homocysteine methyltransferase [Clostridia bacterium]|nr:homocysteine methyltransferase [Clostridia bacterium]